MQTFCRNTRIFSSYVPQGNTIFAGSIAENMRMVKEDATDEEIREVLEMACAYDFVKKLPKGMETVVGEKGSGLSEGQAQRLAIARALLKNAPVLILDEADFGTGYRYGRTGIKKHYEEGERQDLCCYDTSPKCSFCQ